MTSDIRVHDLGMGKSSKPLTPLKCYFIFLTYADILLTIIRKFSYLDIWYHLWQASTQKLKALGSKPQGGARGLNLEHIF